MAQILDFSDADPHARFTVIDGGLDDEAERIGALDYSDFIYVLPQGKAICTATNDPWPDKSLNAYLPWKRIGKADVPPWQWLAKNQAVGQMSWWPGLPEIIHDKIIEDGGIRERQGVSCYNLYRRPRIAPGDPENVELWRSLIRRLYPGEADHFEKWCAHRVQRPDEKINHALVLGGSFGIGKDTILEPVKYAVGYPNFAEIEPDAIMGRFNGFLKSVVLRISELTGQTKIDPLAMHSKLKTIIAAPPDTKRIDEKNLREFMIPNVTGVIQTTNEKDSFYLPPNDRRNFVCWSELTAADFPANFWTYIYAWYRGGGLRNVATYLHHLDLSSFDAKAPPPQTDAFKEVVDLHRPVEDEDLTKIIEELKKPQALTIECLTTHAGNSRLEYHGILTWLESRGNRKKFGSRLEACSYVKVRNPDDARDGQWSFGNKKRVVYARRELPIRERLNAAKKLAERAPC